MSVTQLPERPVYQPPDPGRPSFVPPATPQSAAAERELPAWSPARRFGFRFIFAYLVLYLLPFPVSSIPGSWNPARWWGQGEQWLGLWTETHVFGLGAPVPVVPTGSGDTMLGFASQVNCVLLALGIAIVWSVLDRKRVQYARLGQWLQVFVRFGLATIMFGYGFAKIIPTQMPAPFLDRLVEPYGEFSPMGVLWAFMGHSSVYQIFTGFGEAIGGFLLVFRRTTTLGALLLCGVLANVVLLNYTFDVPVKLYSSNLLLMAIFLAAPDAKRLINALVLNRAVAPRVITPLFATLRARVIAACLVTAFVGYTIYGNVTQGLSYYRTLAGPAAPQSPVYGIWDVESLTKNAVDQPPLLSDSLRLKRVVFAELNRAVLRFMSDSVERYAVKVDSAKGVVTLTGRFDPKLVRTMSYTKPDARHLVLAGTLGADSVVVRLRRFDETKLNLRSRGYHWVQEQPFNR